MARKFLVGGNFKMNCTQLSLIHIIQNINDAKLDPDVELVVAPSTIHLMLAAQHLRRDVSLAAQNVFDQPDGAFTGETSVSQLVDLSIKWTILGHSERRALGEADDYIARKARHAASGGLNVIWCCGETLEQREAGQTNSIVAAQLRALKKGGFTQWSHIAIAYEPIWAIGTGKVATAAQAQEVHESIREWLMQEVSAEVSKQVRIIYGGSVSEKNCRDLSKMPDIDGFLVGGASLKPGFIDIVNCKQ